jgi:hypothetical protein
MAPNPRAILVAPNPRRAIRNIDKTLAPPYFWDMTSHNPDNLR